ncbi:MAG: hypothetical protein IKF77_02160, partial [Thermoguttaceae bacterium]|nr:hypothetical protein [Thermoguttaceae bacterium]
MDKTAIKNFAVSAREKLISTVQAKAALVGITEKGIAGPLPSSGYDIQFFDVGRDRPYKISGEEVRYREALVTRLKSDRLKSDYETAYRSLIEETAYTWFNR